MTARMLHACVLEFHKSYKHGHAVTVDLFSRIGSRTHDYCDACFWAQHDFVQQLEQLLLDICCHSYIKQQYQQSFGLCCYSRHSGDRH